jgi:multiple antibiotic resistance protein
VTHAADRAFKKEVAIRGSLVASAIVLCVLVLGKGAVGKFEISLDALRLGAGLVLLVSALRVIFPNAEPLPADSRKPGALELAISPVAMPIIVPPAGIAAILLSIMIAPNYPGMESVIALMLATIMALDFLVMFFIEQVLKVPGLLLGLRVLGSMLTFIQVALAIDTVLAAFRSLGIIQLAAPLQ